jgi:charged multivesicular body protein 7
MSYPSSTPEGKKADALEQSAAGKFVAHLEKEPVLSYTDSLFDLETFRRAYGDVCVPGSSSISEGAGRLSKRDVTVLVKWLVRDMGVAVSDGTVRPLYVWEC